MITSKQLLENIDIGIREATKMYPRRYLGMSGIGDPCARKIWLQWRWAKQETFSARMLRLFDRGNQEEFRFVNWLRQAGIEVQEIDSKTGRQFEFITHYSHCKGHCDGIAVVNNKNHIVEMKTHNNKSFVALKRSNSVKVSKYVHYCQLQRYMHAKQLDNGLYLAINKDNDALYLEFIKRDEETVQWLLEREIDLLSRMNAPQRLMDKPGYWLCNFCIFKDMCFYQEPYDINCRSCKNSKLDK